MLIYLRSILFDLFFYTFTACYLTILWPLMILMPRKFTVYMARAWTRICFGALRHIVGLTYTIHGQDHLDQALANGPCIIACKHQSAFETILCHVLLPDFVIVLKKQLLAIPVFGSYLKKLSAITIDRENGTASLRSLIQQGREAIKNKHSIFIFPEGTRSTPGATIAYQRGISILYRDLNVPVVPIALNTGVFWGRRSFFKRPGHIIIDIKPALEAGLDRDFFMQTLEDTIENASKELLDIPPARNKRHLVQKIVVAIISLGIGAGSYGYFYAKSHLETWLKNAGIRYSSMHFSLGISTLPCCKLSNVVFDVMPTLTITAQKVRLTPTHLRALTLEAKGVALMRRGANDQGTPSTTVPFLMVKNLEAFMEKRSNGFDMPWVHLEQTKIMLNSDNTYHVGVLEGNVKNRTQSIHFMVSTPSSNLKNAMIPANNATPTPVSTPSSIESPAPAPSMPPVAPPLPILYVKGDMTIEPTITGTFWLQTSIGDVILTALTEHKQLNQAQADAIRPALKPVEHEDNPDLRQVTFSLQADGVHPIN